MAHLESDRKGFGAYFYKIIRLYFYVVINAYVYMCSMHPRRDTFSTSSEDESIGVRKALSDERTSCF